MATIQERNHSFRLLFCYQRTTRRVPLTPFLSKVLKIWLKQHPGGQYLFCHNGEVFRSKKRSKTTGHSWGKKWPTSLKGRLATVKVRERTRHEPLTKDEAHDPLQEDARRKQMEGSAGLAYPPAQLRQ